MPTPEVEEFFAKIQGSDEGAVEAMLQEMDPFLRRVIRMRLLDGRLRRAADTTDIPQALLNAKVGGRADSLRMRFIRVFAAMLTELGYEDWSAMRRRESVCCRLQENVASHRLRFAADPEYRRWDLNPHPLARTGF